MTATHGRPVYPRKDCPLNLFDYLDTRLETFDEAPLTTYVQSWDEKDLSKEDLVGKPLAWRARYWRDFANTLGEEVPSTFEDDVLAFDVTPGRRYAISTRFGPDPSEGDRVEYVFTVS